MVDSVIYHSPIGKIKIEVTETVILSILFAEDEREGALCLHPILEKRCYNWMNISRENVKFHFTITIKRNGISKTSIPSGTADFIWKNMYL